MDTGLLIYFSSLAVLALFFLGGVVMAYRLNKESKTRGFKILIFNVLFVLAMMSIAGSGGYMAFDERENTRQIIQSIDDPISK